MDWMKDLHELCETLTREIADTNDKIRAAGGKITAGDMDYIDKLTHALKSVKSVMAMGDDDGYSGRYAYDYPRRDNMRYSRRYSRGGGMVDELRDLMRDAPDERTKAEFQRFISKIETM